MSISSTNSFVTVAGATGNLGSLIALSLRKRNIAVKALVRPGTSQSRTQSLRDAGVTIAEVNMTDVPALIEALQGCTTVVSALQGLRDVMLGAQGTLLDAAVAAKVSRFIPSDFSLDFTKCAPGSNRNLDLRLASGQIPLIQEGWHRVLYFGSADQLLDVTTVSDTAAYTAAVAADPNPTPKFLRIAGDSFSAKSLAETVTKLRGETYTPMWTGSVGVLQILTAILKFLIGGEEDKLMPAWQGMQYLENMVSGRGKLDPLDNERYPELEWTSIEMALKEADEEKASNAKMA
ncbi:hypothetical protein LZ554_003080 [Drepanopeziza brunnea f. sp. 'monogermtubi']|nr:hypothetical protein LZ554_003080 [Drepanopeziza brunnea f. sp. 'monogermtubi']